MPGDRVRVVPGQRPDAPAVGFQRWDRVLFLHWPVPAEVLRPLIHERLSVDTFEGRAWVSFTPLTIVGARVRLTPPLPGVSTFHELNVRTYVRRDGHEPGIWFFSLEAASPVAVALARAAFRLPYCVARITREQTGQAHRYECVRTAPHPRRGMFAATWESEGEPAVAPPGSLDEFLVERYVMFSKALDGKLWRGPVRHHPWPLRAVRRLQLVQTLDRADRLPELGPPALLHDSDGVDVDFLPFTIV